MCEHLRQLGLNAAVESKVHKKLSDGSTIMGSVKLAFCNIDLVELEWRTRNFSSSDIDDARSLFLSDRRSPELFCGTELSCFWGYFLEQGMIWAYHASRFVQESLIKSELTYLLRGIRLPLTELVEFQTTLQRGNRVQVPKVVRWKFKLESDQVLKVTVGARDMIVVWETYYACMDKSGRITVPKMIQNELLKTAPGLQSLIGTVVGVRLAPA